MAALRTRVVAEYDRLDAPRWPDPHPDGAPAREGDYSRLTDPGRYAIVGLRARVWAEELGKLPGVKVEPLAPAPLDDEGHYGRFDRGVRITSSRPATLPLLLLARDAPLTSPDGSPRAPDGTLTVLHVSVVEPEICLAMHPDCGCDACDRGSDDLLTAIDQPISKVVGGPFVVLRGKRWQAYWHPDGGSSGGQGRGPDHHAAMRLCRLLAAGERVRLPRGVRAFAGRPWLD